MFWSFSSYVAAGFATRGAMAFVVIEPANFWELCGKVGDDGKIGGVSRRVSSLPEPLKESDTP